MDLQEIVDSYDMAAIVMSVEDKGNDLYGDIRIVRANAAYRKIQPGDYHDNMLYSEMIPPEPKFEDFCYRCAVKKQYLHSYVETKSLNVWSNTSYLPLSKSLDKGNLHYFLFTIEFTEHPEYEKMSDVSIDSAAFIIKTCLKLRGSFDFCTSMNEVISDIQKKTDSFCSAIILIDSENQKSSLLCSKFRNDSASFKDFEKVLTNEVIMSWEKMVEMHDNIMIKDEADMQKYEKINPVWVKSLRAGHVESVILVPFVHMKKNMGYLFVTNFNVERLIEIKEIIELTAFFLNSEIASNNMMERLELMSNMDLLTGLRNRNSMNYRVDLSVSGEKKIAEPYGVIFADLNGLKRANDAGGHSAGDVLLKNAAALLRDIFERYEVYRAGGDEFVVIVPECQEKEFDSLVCELRSKTGFGSDITFATGSYWDEKGGDVRVAMHLADEAMYADKKRFYEAHPELKSR